MSACDLHLHPHTGGPPKIAYHSRGEAEAAIRTIHRRGERRGRMPCRTYLCDGCSRWFLTATPS